MRELNGHRLRVLRRWPHPGRGFTQGLLAGGDTVWESTGGYGQSSLRRYRLGDTGPGLLVPLAPELFGEGICLAGGQLWQLTWRERVALRRDPGTGEVLATIPFQREGWGICAMDGAVVTSDGTSELIVRDAQTLAPARLIRVRCDGRRVSGLNDLAWSGGRIWANVAPTAFLAGIDPGSGEVTDLADARPVMERRRGDPQAILNGIAPMAGPGEFLLTGKGWRCLYHVALGPARRPLRPELLPD